MRVLIIEDDEATAKSIEYAITSEGILCDSTDSGQDGYDMAKLYDYDIIILDMLLPDVNGFEVLRKLRAGNINTPVLILSSLTGSEDKIKGLGIGADDYVAKPFNKNEIIERVRAIVRRSKGFSNPSIKIGRLTIDTKTRIVEIDGKKVDLTNKEFSVLELMAMRRNNPISKDSFLDHLYGGMDEPELKIIDVFVCKLRKKLEDASGGEGFIETVWGRGYMLADKVAADNNEKKAAPKNALSKNTISKKTSPK
jgi:two-component system cell cycle response regulator CtrA